MQLPRAEFERLALEQLDAVDRFARTLATGPDADDLVQEAYFRAIRSYTTFQLQPQGIRPWLYRILYNVNLARSQRERGQPKATEPEHLERFAAPDVAAPDELIDNAELDAAMARLDPDLKSAMMLWAVDELPYKEIAAVLGIPIGTVMSRLHRARRKLADLLGLQRRPAGRAGGTASTRLPPVDRE